MFIYFFIFFSSFLLFFFFKKNLYLFFRQHFSYYFFFSFFSYIFSKIFFFITKFFNNINFLYRYLFFFFLKNLYFSNFFIFQKFYVYFIFILFSFKNYMINFLLFFLFFEPIGHPFFKLFLYKCNKIFNNLFLWWDYIALPQQDHFLFIPRWEFVEDGRNQSALCFEFRNSYSDRFFFSTLNFFNFFLFATDTCSYSTDYLVWHKVGFFTKETYFGRCTIEQHNSTGILFFSFPFKYIINLRKYIFVIFGQVQTGFLYKTLNYLYCFLFFYLIFFTKNLKIRHYFFLFFFKVLINFILLSWFFFLCVFFSFWFAWANFDYTDMSWDDQHLFLRRIYNKYLQNFYKNHYFLKNRTYIDFNFFFKEFYIKKNMITTDFFFKSFYNYLVSNFYKKFEIYSRDNKNFIENNKIFIIFYRLLFFLHYKYELAMLWYRYRSRMSYKRFFPLLLNFYINASFLFKIMNVDLHLLNKVPNYYYIYREQISRFFIEGFDKRIPLFDLQTSRWDNTVFLPMMEELRSSIFVEWSPFFLEDPWTQGLLFKPEKFYNLFFLSPHTYRKPFFFRRTRYYTIKLFGDHLDTYYVWLTKKIIKYKPNVWIKKNILFAANPVNFWFQYLDRLKLEREKRRISIPFWFLPDIYIPKRVFYGYQQFLIDILPKNSTFFSTLKTEELKIFNILAYWWTYRFNFIPRNVCLNGFNNLDFWEWRKNTIEKYWTLLYKSKAQGISLAELDELFSIKKNFRNFFSIYLPNKNFLHNFSFFSFPFFVFFFDFFIFKGQFGSFKRLLIFTSFHNNFFLFFYSFFQFLNIFYYFYQFSFFFQYFYKYFIGFYYRFFFDFFNFLKSFYNYLFFFFSIGFYFFENFPSFYFFHKFSFFKQYSGFYLRFFFLKNLFVIIFKKQLEYARFYLDGAFGFYTVFFKYKNLFNFYILLQNIKYSKRKNLRFLFSLFYFKNFYRFFNFFFDFLSLLGIFFNFNFFKFTSHFLFGERSNIFFPFLLEDKFYKYIYYKSFLKNFYKKKKNFSIFLKTQKQVFFVLKKKFKFTNRLDRLKNKFKYVNNSRNSFWKSFFKKFVFFYYRKYFFKNTGDHIGLSFSYLLYKHIFLIFSEHFWIYNWNNLFYQYKYLSLRYLSFSFFYENIKNYFIYFFFVDFYDKIELSRFFLRSIGSNLFFRFFNLNTLDLLRYYKYFFKNQALLAKRFFFPLKKGFLHKKFFPVLLNFFFQKLKNRLFLPQKRLVNFNKINFFFIFRFLKNHFIFSFFFKKLEEQHFLLKKNVKNFFIFIFFFRTLKQSSSEDFLKLYENYSFQNFYKSKNFFLLLNDTKNKPFVFNVVKDSKTFWFLNRRKKSFLARSYLWYNKMLFLLKFDKFFFSLFFAKFNKIFKQFFFINETINFENCFWDILLFKTMFFFDLKKNIVFFSDIIWINLYDLHVDTHTFFYLSLPIQTNVWFLWKLFRFSYKFLFFLHNFFFFSNFFYFLTFFSNSFKIFYQFFQFWMLKCNFFSISCSFFVYEAFYLYSHEFNYNFNRLVASYSFHDFSLLKQNLKKNNVIIISGNQFYKLFLFFFKKKEMFSSLFETNFFPFFRFFFFNNQKNLDIGYDLFFRKAIPSLPFSSSNIDMTSLIFNKNVSESFFFNANTFKNLYLFLPKFIFDLSKSFDFFCEKKKRWFSTTMFQSVYSLTSYILLQNFENESLLKSNQILFKKFSKFFEVKKKHLCTKKRSKLSYFFSKKKYDFQLNFNSFFLFFYHWFFNLKIFWFKDFFYFLKYIKNDNLIQQNYLLDFFESLDFFFFFKKSFLKKKLFFYIIKIFTKFLKYKKFSKNFDYSLASKSNFFYNKFYFFEKNKNFSNIFKINIFNVNFKNIFPYQKIPVTFRDDFRKCFFNFFKNFFRFKTYHFYFFFNKIFLLDCSKLFTKKIYLTLYKIPVKTLKKKRKLKWTFFPTLSSNLCIYFYLFLKEYHECDKSFFKFNIKKIICNSPLYSFSYLRKKKFFFNFSLFLKNNLQLARNEDNFCFNFFETLYFNKEKFVNFFFFLRFFFKKFFINQKFFLFNFFSKIFDFFYFWLNKTQNNLLNFSLFNSNIFSKKKNIFHRYTLKNFYNTYSVIPRFDFYFFQTFFIFILQFLKFKIFSFFSDYKNKKKRFLFRKFTVFLLFNFENYFSYFLRHFFFKVFFKNTFLHFSFFFFYEKILHNFFKDYFFLEKKIIFNSFSFIHKSFLNTRFRLFFSSNLLKYEGFVINFKYKNVFKYFYVFKKIFMFFFNLTSILKVYIYFVISYFFFYKKKNIYFVNFFFSSLSFITYRIFSSYKFKVVKKISIFFFRKKNRNFFISQLKKRTIIKKLLFFNFSVVMQFSKIFFKQKLSFFFFIKQFIFLFKVKKKNIMLVNITNYLYKKDSYLFSFFSFFNFSFFFFTLKQNLFLNSFPFFFFRLNPFYTFFSNSFKIFDLNMYKHSFNLTELNNIGFILKKIIFIFPLQKLQSLHQLDLKNYGILFFLQSFFFFYIFFLIFINFFFLFFFKNLFFVYEANNYFSNLKKRRQYLYNMLIPEYLLLKDMNKEYKNFICNSTKDFDDNFFFFAKKHNPANDNIFSFLSYSTWSYDVCQIFETYFLNFWDDFDLNTKPFLFFTKIDNVKRFYLKKIFDSFSNIFFFLYCFLFVSFKKFLPSFFIFNTLFKIFYSFYFIALKNIFFSLINWIVNKLYNYANQISIQIFSNEAEYFLLPPLRFYHIFSKIKPSFFFFARKHILFFKPYSLDLFFFLFLFLQNWQNFFSFYTFFKKMLFFFPQKKYFSRKDFNFYSLFWDSNFINLSELPYRVYSFMHLNNRPFYVFFKVSPFFNFSKLFFFFFSFLKRQLSFFHYYFYQWITYSENKFFSRFFYNYQFYYFFLAFLGETQYFKFKMNSKQIFNLYKIYDYKLRFFLYEDPFKNEYFNSFTKLHMRLRFLQQQKLDFILAKEIATIFLQKQTLQYQKSLKSEEFFHIKFSFREKYFFLSNLGINNTDMFEKNVKLLSLFCLFWKEWLQ